MNDRVFDDAELNEDDDVISYDSSFGSETESAFNLDDIGKGADEEPEGEASGQSSKETKKVALIITGALFVIVLIVVFIAARLHNSIERAEKEAPVKVESQQEKSNKSTSNKQQSSSNKQQTQQSQSTVKNSTAKVSNGNNWTELSEVSLINFDENMKEMVFTVTEVHMYARQTGSNSLNVKSTLVGSLAGMAGTYTLDVPYDKGSKISIGTEFTVYVQLGEYSGKTVVGEITYK